jgi:hypothetical protein
MFKLILDFYKTERHTKYFYGVSFFKLAPVANPLRYFPPDLRVPL